MSFQQVPWYLPNRALVFTYFGDAASLVRVSSQLWTEAVADSLTTREMEAQDPDARTYKPMAPLSNTSEDSATMAPNWSETNHIHQAFPHIQLCILSPGSPLQPSGWQMASPTQALLRHLSSRDIPSPA